MASADSIRIPALKVSCNRSYAERILQGFSAMQRCDQMTDFIIKTSQGKRIPAHRMLLSVASHYFQAMFNSRMREVKIGEIFFQTFSDNAVRSVVDYMYGREITVAWGEVAEYLDVVATLQLDELKKQIEEYIIKHTTKDNAIENCRLAETFGLLELKAKTKLVISSHFVAICRAHKYFTLSEMIALLKDKDLISVRNDAKLKVAIDWIIAQEDERKDSFAELVDCIDLQKCSPSYLANILQKYEGRFIKQVSLYAKISKAMASGVIKGQNTAGEGRFLITGITNAAGNLIKQMYRVDMTAETVEEAGDIPDKLLHFGSARCVTQSGLLFSASGGTTASASSATNGCVLYDPATKILKHLPPLPKPRLLAGAAAIGSKVYLMGGYKYNKKMSCMDISRNLRRDCADMQHGVGIPITCSIDQNIFVLTNSVLFGGLCYHEGDPIILQCYDSDEDTWGVRAAPPVKDTSGATAVAVWGIMYVVGGKDRVCVSYSPQEDTWYSHKRPSKPHAFGGAIHLDDKIILCGGSSSDVIEVYDIQRDKWETSPLKLPFPAKGMVCINE